MILTLVQVHHKQPASLAAGRVSRQVPKNSEHHQHQVDSRLAGDPNKQASSAASCTKQYRPRKADPQNEHHQHKLGCFLHRHTSTANILRIRWTLAWQVPQHKSIISVSWVASCTAAPKQSASSASGELSLATCPKQASIISIRWTLAWQMPPKNEHHSRQLSCFSYR